MAKQLFSDRTKQGFDAVGRFAAANAHSETGALAYFVLGYAHNLDNDYDKALASLRKAQPHATEISDYIDFEMARAYDAKGSPGDVVTVLDGFVKRHPDTLLAKPAVMLLAKALQQTGEAERAAEALAPFRQAAGRADVELAYANAKFSAGDQAAAIASYRKIYYEMPTTAEADAAGARLKTLDHADPADTRELRRLRADLLAKARRYAQAIAEYQQLVAEAGDARIPALRVALAHALYRADRVGEAKQELLVNTDAQGEAAAERLYLLADVARSESDDVSQSQYLGELRQSDPASPWFQEALLSSGNMYLLRHDFPDAIQSYSELASVGGPHAPFAHWKAAFLTYRSGNVEEAKRLLEEQIEMYPASEEVPGALYWRGRIAEDDKQPDIARAYYTKLSDRFRHYYYSDLARERLSQLVASGGEGATSDNKNAGDQLIIPLLARIPDEKPATDLTGADADDDIHYLRGKLLANGALFDQALNEFHAADTSAATVREIVQTDVDAGRNAQAIEALKHSIPYYEAVDMSAIPRDLWEALFPRPFWAELRANAQAHSLDPYLVASLIRQESEFNPVAISRAQAYGLMQLLPSVGKTLAKAEKVRHFSTNSLLDPAINLKLGTRYFQEVLALNGGKVEYALAAYNAGQHRVDEWLANDKFRDTPEFVESIPFTETREYVQAIMRNRSLYKELYGAP